MTFGVMTLGIPPHSAQHQKYSAQSHNDERRYDLCHHAGCRGAFEFSVGLG